MRERARIEARLVCPVCLGSTLAKTEVSADPVLLLDHCTRCGGIWFDAGEVQQLRRLQSQQLWSSVPQRAEPPRVQCHACHGFMDRRAEVCPSCGHRVVLECPQCAEPMQTARHEEVTLDFCRRCHGIWFDHEELAAIWRLQLDRALRRRGSRATPEGVMVLADALAYDPFLTWYGLHAAAHGAAAAGELLANAPEALGGATQALGGAAEAVGDAAAGVFETLLEIIGGIFS